jgi:hypothetical protein
MLNWYGYTKKNGRTWMTKTSNSLDHQLENMEKEGQKHKNQKKLTKKWRKGPDWND